MTRIVFPPLHESMLQIWAMSKIKHEMLNIKPLDIPAIYFPYNPLLHEPLPSRSNVYSGSQIGNDGIMSPGWLMTAVSSWGENREDAFDQGLVELGLGDVRLITVEGAMLPMGFGAVAPEPLPMGSLVECHLAVAHCFDGGIASAGVAWAKAITPEGDECAIVAKISTQIDSEETELLLRRNLQRRLASRDLEVHEFDVAVDEVTAGQGHNGVALAALILPDSLGIQQRAIGRVRGGGVISIPTEKNPTPRGPQRKKPKKDSINFDF